MADDLGEYDDYKAYKAYKRDVYGPGYLGLSSEDDDDFREYSDDDVDDNDNDLLSDGVFPAKYLRSVNSWRTSSKQEEEPIESQKKSPITITVTFEEEEEEEKLPLEEGSEVENVRQKRKRTFLEKLSLEEYTAMIAQDAIPMVDDCLLREQMKGGKKPELQAEESSEATGSGGKTITF